MTLQKSDIVTFIISIAYLAVLASGILVLLRWGKVACHGPEPVGMFTLVALLFTAGLDMGLVMLPLTEFPIYASEPAYAFSNPLAVEFGMWGPLVWLMYFVATFYFVVIEPKLKLFEIPVVKWVYNLTIIATCAFTCYLFMINLPVYAPGLPQWSIWILVMAVLAFSVVSSGSFGIMKWLAIISTYGFGVLAFAALSVAALAAPGVGADQVFARFGLIFDYFGNLHHFVTPISDYHEFYLFWWFSWSIMIGQFVARYVGGLHAWKLAFAMVVLPTIPLGVWFCVLYVYYIDQIVIPVWLNWMMISVGIVFVVNSLDSLIRLYSQNLGWGRDKLPDMVYYPLHFFLQLALVGAYFYTPFQIQWVGLVVIGLYAAVYWMMFTRLSAWMGVFPLRNSAP